MRLLRDPLLHFLVLGAGIGWMTRNKTGLPPKVIRPLLVVLSIFPFLVPSLFGRAESDPALLVGYLLLAYGGFLFLARSLPDQTRLLAPMATMMVDRTERVSLSTTSMRSLLDGNSPVDRFHAGERGALDRAGFPGPMMVEREAGAADCRPLVLLNVWNKRIDQTELAKAAGRPGAQLLSLWRWSLRQDPPTARSLSAS